MPSKFFSTERENPFERVLCDAEVKADSMAEDEEENVGGRGEDLFMVG